MIHQCLPIGLNGFNQKRIDRGTLGHLMELNKEVEVIGNIFDNPELGGDQS